MAKSRRVLPHCGNKRATGGSMVSLLHAGLIWGVLLFQRRFTEWRHGWLGLTKTDAGRYPRLLRFRARQLFQGLCASVWCELCRQAGGRSRVAWGCACVTWFILLNAAWLPAQTPQATGFQGANIATLAVVFHITTELQDLEPAGGEDIRQSLQSSRLPWYDAEADRIKSVPLKEGLPSASNDRATIPEAQVTPQAAPVRTVGTVSMARNGWLTNALVYTLVAVGIVIVLYVLAQTVIGNKDTDQDDEEFDTQQLTEVERVQVLPYAMSGDPANFRSLAERLTQEKDYKMAIIYMFSHLLLQLDKSRWIALRAGRTNRQYLWDLPWDSPLRDYFERSMMVFEEAFFGDKQVSSETFLPLWEQLPAMEVFIKQRAGEMNYV